MSISLNIEEYCKDCVDFEADVDKIRIDDSDGSFRCITTIECKNKDHCKAFFNYLTNYIKREQDRKRKEKIND